MIVTEEVNAFLSVMTFVTAFLYHFTELQIRGESRNFMMQDIKNCVSNPTLWVLIRIVSMRQF